MTHDPEVASRADRRIVLKDGLIVEDTLPGPSESILKEQGINSNETRNG